MDTPEKKAKELYPDLESTADNLSKFSANEVNTKCRESYAKGFEDGYTEAIESAPDDDDDKKPKGKK